MRFVIKPENFRKVKILHLFCSVKKLLAVRFWWCLFFEQLRWTLLLLFWGRLQIMLPSKKLLLKLNKLVIDILNKRVKIFVSGAKNLNPLLIPTFIIRTNFIPCRKQILIFIFQQMLVIRRQFQMTATLFILRLVLPSFLYFFQIVQIYFSNLLSTVGAIWRVRWALRPLLVLQTIIGFIWLIRFNVPSKVLNIFYGHWKPLNGVINHVQYLFGVDAIEIGSLGSVTLTCGWALVWFWPSYRAGGTNAVFDWLGGTDSSFSVWLPRQTSPLTWVLTSMLRHFRHRSSPTQTDSSAPDTSLLRTLRYWSRWPPTIYLWDIFILKLWYFGNIDGQIPLSNALILIEIIILFLIFIA